MGRSIRRLVAGYLLAAAFYLLLIDSVDTPELIVAGVAAALAATGFELAREEHIAREAIRLRWLARAALPVLRVPGDIATLAVVAVRQLVSPQRARGEFRTAPFRARADEPFETGKRALAEAIGSSQPFYLAYQGHNNRDLQSVYGALVCRIMAERYPPAALAGPPSSDELLLARTTIAIAFQRRIERSRRSTAASPGSLASRSGGIETRTPSECCSGPEPSGPGGWVRTWPLEEYAAASPPLYGPGLGRGLPPGKASRRIVRWTIPHCLSSGPVL